MKLKIKFYNRKIIFFFIFFYILVSFFDIFSFKDEKIDLEFISYKPKTKIYSDRDYINVVNDDFLINKILLRQPRHNTKNIRIKTDQEIIILRAKCNNNINKFFTDWHRLNKKIHIKGYTCTHSELIKKKFKSGYISILSGGPIASDPIFIELINSDTRLSFL